MNNCKIIVVNTPEELADAHAVRTQVFQQEQGIPAEDDFDGRDHTAINVVIYDAEPIGTARVRFPDSQKIAKVERVAILKEYRGKNIGRKIMEFIDAHLSSLNIDSVYLDSQESAKGFYEKLGYLQEGEVFDEVGIPHVKMVKRLKEPSI
jgi:predicted GNAT family N-acyltransferase